MTSDLPADTAGGSTRAVVDRFWSAMQANDWTRAAACLASDIVVDWPCSGEQIVGREDYAALQAEYPTETGSWTFDIHRLLVEGDRAVSELTVSDGDQSARVVAFSRVSGEHIVEQVEYWPAFYDPPPGRERLTRAGPRVP